MIGKVKWFNDKKGYGFIKGDVDDIFFYYIDILKDGYKSLINNQIVEFELVKTDKGYKAKKITEFTVK